VIRRILTVLVVLAGCLALGYDALYPPRRERLHAVGKGDETEVETFRSRHSDTTDADRAIPRRFLFSDTPQYYSANPGYSSYILTEIDTGRLTAEAMLILAITGATAVALNVWRPWPSQPQR